MTSPALTIFEREFDLFRSSFGSQFDNVSQSICLYSVEVSRSYNIFWIDGIPRETAFDRYHDVLIRTKKVNRTRRTQDLNEMIPPRSWQIVANNKSQSLESTF